MVKLRSLQFLLTGIVCVTMVATAIAPENDADTGGDASDVRAAPTMLQAFGSYDGKLHALDQDWFGVTTSNSVMQPFCVVTDAEGNTNSSVTLAIKTPGGELSISAPVQGGGERQLALAGTGVSQAVLGVVPTLNPAGNDASRPMTYEFALAGFAPGDLGPGDMGTNTDAGVGASAIPATTSCISGQLMPLGGLGDAIDAYSFVGKAGERIQYTLGSSSTAIRVNVVNANGVELPNSSIAAGALGDIVLPSDGTYYLAASQQSGTTTVSYIIGLVGPPGCEPMC